MPACLYPSREIQYSIARMNAGWTMRYAHSVFAQRRARILIHTMATRQEQPHHPFDRYRRDDAPPMRDIFLRNMVGGIAWGLGSVLGTTVVIAVIAGVLRRIDFVPLIGTFIKQLSTYTH